MTSAGPVTMLVAYAGDAATPFDRRHWIDVHLPLVRECWGPDGLERVAGFFPDGDGGGLVALAICVFRDEAAMHAASVPRRRSASWRMSATSPVSSRNAASF